MEKNREKRWVTPKLTVMVRSNPEEAVLTGCKVDVKGTVGPGYERCNEKKLTPCSGVVIS